MEWGCPAASGLLLLLLPSLWPLCQGTLGTGCVSSKGQACIAAPGTEMGLACPPTRLWPCQGVRGDRRGSLKSRWERSRLLGVQINLPSARAKSPTFSTLTKFSFYGCRVPPFPYFLEWSPNSFSHSLIKTWLSFPSWKSRDPHSSNMACCHYWCPASILTISLGAAVATSCICAGISVTEPVGTLWAAMQPLNWSFSHVPFGKVLPAPRMDQEHLHKRL